jgi:cytochrome c-type biogenesis protein CcmH
MNTFWLIAAALLIAVIGMLLPAALRARIADGGRDSHRALHARRLAELTADLDDEVIDAADRQSAEDEITRALLEEADTPAAAGTGPVARWLTTAAVALVIPGVALLTYNRLGQPQLSETPVQAPAPEATSPQSMEAVLAQLEQRLQQNPDSAEGWMLLGRSYMVLARYTDAVAAFERAYALLGDVPQVMLQYADALAMTNNGRIGPQARELVERTIALEPDNIAGLWLGGLAAVETGQRELALERLNRARTLSAERGSATAELDAIIAGIGAASGNTVAGSSPADTAAPEAAKSSAIAVRVTLAPALAERISATDVLFVFARAPGGGGPPLAVVRTSPGELPRSFVLDETSAMAPQFRLTPGATVDITARISRSGTPTATSGDLQGKVAAVTAGQNEPVEITINEIVD